LPIGSASARSGAFSIAVGAVCPGVSAPVGSAGGFSGCAFRLAPKFAFAIIISYLVIWFVGYVPVLPAKFSCFKGSAVAVELEEQSHRHAG
jgi:hypothetical protein